MNTENTTTNNSKKEHNLQFKKLVIHILPNTKNKKERIISLGSCYCFIEGDELQIDAIECNDEHE